MSAHRRSPAGSPQSASPNSRSPRLQPLRRPATASPSAAAGRNRRRPATASPAATGLFGSRRSRPDTPSERKDPLLSLHADLLTQHQNKIRAGARRPLSAARSKHCMRYTPPMGTPPAAWPGWMDEEHGSPLDTRLLIGGAAQSSPKAGGSDWAACELSVIVDFRASEASEGAQDPLAVSLGVGTVMAKQGHPSCLCMRCVQDVSG